jgi:hypothetical protein
MRLAPETLRARLDGQGGRCQATVPPNEFAVSCPSAFRLRSGSMWLSLSVVATSAAGCSSWSLLLNLPRLPRSFCARELIVSGSYECADRRRARWVALTCIRAFVDSGQSGGFGRRIQEGHHELHRLPTYGQLPTFRAGLF